jgi:hypothetical protein
MNNLKRILLILSLLLLLIPSGSAQAQDYRFSLSAYEVEAYLEADGSLTLYYYMAFQNDPSGHAIEYVDLGLPTSQYKLSDIKAEINGIQMPQVNDSAYVQGAELALGEYAIQPGEAGVVTAWVYGVKGILSPYDSGDRTDYANFLFIPNYFGSQYDRSQNTEYRMTIILPPAVGAEEGVWYEPSGWPGSNEPEANMTTDGRVNYSWYTNNADVHSQYRFGAAFPASAVPAGVLVTEKPFPDDGGSTVSPAPSFFSRLWTIVSCAFFPLVFIGLSILAIIQSKKQTDKRKMQYLPPKISVEGKGIKRGLTAVEAGILLEEPLDKVLTMILFGLLKKELVTVINRDPLKLDIVEPLPEGLYPYEQAFLEAFKDKNKAKRQTGIKSLMIDLVKDVADKMKGFSAKETKEYYQDIIRRAWEAVETAQTPDVKSAQYDHTLEWTMLDKEFNDRTERTFTGVPVFVPRWWPRYDPAYRPAPSSAGSGGGLAAPVTTSSGSGSSRPSINLPSLPGADFAASMVTGASNMAAGVIGNVTDFTSSVTNRTNPIPVTTSRSGSGGFRGSGGGSSCACACACAGCACACAGGGR